MFTPTTATAEDKGNCLLEMFIEVSSLVLRLNAPVHNLEIKYRAGFVVLTGLVAPFAGQ